MRVPPGYALVDGAARLHPPVRRRGDAPHLFPPGCMRQTRRAEYPPRRMSDLQAALERARAGGPERRREKSAQQGKLPVRDRIDRLVDSGSFTEEALLANWEQDGLGAD